MQYPMRKINNNFFVLNSQTLKKKVNILELSQLKQTAKTISFQQKLIRFNGTKKRKILAYKRFQGFWFKYWNLSVKQTLYTLKQIYSQQLDSFVTKEDAKKKLSVNKLLGEDYLSYQKRQKGYQLFLTYNQFFRKYRNFGVLPALNVSILDLALKVNAKVGLFKTGRGAFKFYQHRFKPYRYQYDNLISNVVRKGFYNVEYKNNFWLRDQDHRKNLSLIWKRYRYMRNWRPYSYLLKKYKIYFNWADRFLFKRYPLYRRKYFVLFHFPQYSDYRRLFKNQLKEQHLFRWIYRLKYKQLVKKFKKSVKGTKRVFELMFLNFFEMRMDTIVYRCNFAFSIKQGKQWSNRGFFQVNSKHIAWHSYHVNIGDIIMPRLNLRLHFLQKKNWFFDMGLSFMQMRLFYRHIQSDQYPTHLVLNERVPAALVIALPNPQQIRHHRPFSIQFLTLSLNRYS